MKAITDPVYLEIVSRLRQARVSKGVTQVELARRLGIRQSVVSKVEIGERRLDVAECARWCVALDTNLGDIIPVALIQALPGPGVDDQQG